MATGACSSSGSKVTDNPAITGSSVTPSSAGAAGSPAGGSPATTVAAATGTTVSIKSFAFQPSELAAKVGDTITVSNDDGTDHSLTAVDGTFDTTRFSTGTKTFKVDKAGRFEFKCEVHSFMPHGFIQVSG